MKKDLENKNLASLGVAGIVLFIYYFLASVWSENGSLTNIKIYAISALVFFGTLIFSRLLIDFLSGGGYKFSPQFKICCGILLAIWGVIFLFCAYNLELYNYQKVSYNYIRHKIPYIVYILVLVLCSIFAGMLINKAKEKDRPVRLVFTSLVVFVQGLFMYAPNFFKDRMGTLWHMDAYTNSIINAIYFTPYEKYSMSIYGHYGIFYILPVKVLHKLGLNRWLSVTITIALLGALVFAIEYWIISQIIDNDIIYILAVLASFIVSTQIYVDQFYQMLPHRYVFQAIVIAGAMIAYKYRTKKIIKLIMWILAGTAIVWNTETGLVCAGVWMLGSLYIDASENKKYSLYILIKNILLYILTILGAYGFVNGYNLIVGGKLITFGTFIYPLGSNSYPVENIQIALQIPWAGYFIVILASLGILGYYFRDILKINLNQKNLIIVLSAVMCFGVFTYYMNRAVVTNASIASFTFIIIIAFICDNGWKSEIFLLNGLKKISVEHITVYLCYFILVSMALSSVTCIGNVVTTKLESTYETHSLDEFIMDVKGKIPDGTVAFGIGTAQFYSYMDLQTGIYMADWEDLDQSLNGGETLINDEALNYLRENLENNQYPHILVNANQQRYIPSNYYEIDSFEYYGYNFKLFKKLEP